MATTIGEAIHSLKPNSEFSYHNEDYSTIKWDVLDGTAPTLQEITDEIERLDELKSQGETARQTKLNSAITKLKALGLTESEAKIIIGLE